MHRVRCFSDVVSRVHVRHPEFAEETVYELSEKIAYICMYAGDCEITFECSDGVIRKDTIDYEIEKVFDAGQYEEVFGAAAEYGMDNDGIIMSRINDMHKKSEYTPELLDYYKCIKKSDNISSAYRYQINSWMIEYYYTYYKDNDFWHEYVSVDTDDLSDKDAQRLIETLTEAGMYSQSFELVMDAARRLLPGFLRWQITYLLMCRMNITKCLTMLQRMYLDSTYIMNLFLHICPIISMERMTRCTMCGKPLLIMV